MKTTLSLVTGAALWAASSVFAAPDLDATVVIMGEQHDNPLHHANQADWISAMKPAAIVFEMLPADLGPVATAQAGAPATALSKALRWEERGWPDFDAYAPIFGAGQGALILGAEAPRATLEHAMTDGAWLAMGAEDPFGLSANLPAEELERRIALQAAAHCGELPEEMLPGMVEAQRLRDAWLAQAVLDALSQTGGPVAVITGNGHARIDHGVPALLAAARPDLAVTSIGQLSAADAGGAPFDQIVVAPPVGETATDPCDALR